MNKTNYQKWLFRLKHLGDQSDPLKERPRPYRDWHRLMIGWLVLLILTSLIHLWLFQRIKTNLTASPVTDQGQPAAKLDPVRLHQIVEAWQPPTTTATTTTAR